MTGTSIPLNAMEGRAISGAICTACSSFLAKFDKNTASSTCNRENRISITISKKKLPWTIAPKRKMLIIKIAVTIIRARIVKASVYPINLSDAFKGEA